MSQQEKAPPKVWMITGAGRGFGRQWALAALGRGDHVIATARDPEALSELHNRFGAAFLAVTLDVRDREGCRDAVERGVAQFGRIDVLINNAGFGHFGMAEELTEAELRDQMETNFFGAVWMTQAVLPIMREQHAGHIIQVSSIGGITAFSDLSAYHASKWALEGFSQGVAQEVVEFGVAVTIVEPGPFATDWAHASARRSAPHPAYRDAHARRDAQRANSVVGDPATTGETILRIVDAAEPPLRVLLGGDHLLGIAQRDYQSRIDTWKTWIER